MTERQSKAIDWFAEHMKARLLANDHRGDWLGSDANAAYFLERLVEQVDDFGQAVRRHNEDGSYTVAFIIEQAADVGNLAMILADRATYGLDRPAPEKPKIVCLCGSTRFSEAFHKANLQETLAGKIVLSIGCDFKSDDALGLDAGAKARLDELHLRKIEMADEVLILNVDGYIGESTKRELAHAMKLGKVVRFLEEEKHDER